MISKLKVIDASTVLAGPSVGMFFAELGAEVLKIENPIFPDVTRTWKLASESKENSISAYFSSINYRKKYKSLDLKNEIDHSNFIKLIEDADILITNFKKGDDLKFKISDEVLKKVNPKLIHGKISGFGIDSDRVAYDLILQAESGFMSMNGTPESGPIKMPIALIDVLAAHQLKEGILIALLKRTETNLGCTVHVSLYDAAVCSLVNQASGFLMQNNIPQRIGSLHPTIAPYGEIFTTADNQQITFAIGSDAHFLKLCHFLGLEKLPEEELFSSNQNRVIHRKKLFEILQNQLKSFPSNTVLTWMQDHFVPCGKIRNLQEVFEDQRAQSFIRIERIDEIETKRVSSIAFKSW
jgi:crotonobetainyl-CoA:carnitine CoA-transferase CaiB-like acyl-CoA transferase